jgi:regulator of RNase E activity RraA
VQSIGRWKVNAWQIPVTLPGATVKSVIVTPGDFVLGDDDGVIVIPRALIIDVLARAEGLTAKEVRIRQELANGLSLADALRKFGHV